MDMVQRPLASMSSKHYDGKGVLMYETFMDFSNWTETVTNPRTGQSVTFKIDREGNKVGKVS